MSTEPAQLISKSCTPCRGGIPPLTPDEAKAHLRQTPEWALLDDAHRIERTFKFKNFAEAFTFADQLGLTVAVPVPASATPQVANPILLSGTPVSYRSAPPTLGNAAPRE